MKKVLIALLAATMILSFAACAQNSNTSSEGSGDSNISSVAKADDNSKPDNSSSGNSSSQVSSIPVDKFTEFIGQYIDLGHYEESKKEEYASYSKINEFKKEYETSSEIHLLKSHIGLEGNTEIYQRMPYADFTAQGWKPVQQLDLNITMEPKTWLNNGIEFEYNGKTIEVYFGNITDSQITLSNATVERFEIAPYDFLNFYLTPIASSTDFLIERKINNDSGLKEIIDTLGEPAFISYSFSTKNSKITVKYDDYLGGDDLEFTLSSDGKTIYKIFVS